MKGFVLAGTASGVGKTVAALSVLRSLQAAGYEFILIEGFHTAPYPKLVVGDRPVAPPVVARGPPAALDVPALATAMIEGTLLDADPV